AGARPVSQPPTPAQAAVGDRGQRNTAKECSGEPRLARFGRGSRCGGKGRNAAGRILRSKNGGLGELPLHGTAGSFSFRAGNTLAIACAIWPKTSIFIDVRRALDGWIAATLARCSTMKGHYRIRPTIGANKI